MTARYSSSELFKKAKLPIYTVHVDMSVHIPPPTHMCIYMYVCTYNIDIHEHMI